MEFQCKCTQNWSRVEHSVDVMAVTVWWHPAFRPEHVRLFTPLWKANVDVPITQSNWAILIATQTNTICNALYGDLKDHRSTWSAVTHSASLTPSHPPSSLTVQYCTMALLLVPLVPGFSCFVAFEKINAGSFFIWYSRVNTRNLLMNISLNFIFEN